MVINMDPNVLEKDEPEKFGEVEYDSKLVRLKILASRYAYASI